MRILIYLSILALLTHSASASVISFLKNNVYTIQNTNKVSAVLNDKLNSNTQVSTSEKSMCELSFDDKSVTRIGENSLFSFVEEERLIKCDNGKFLVAKDPESPTITVTTGGVTAAISGSTVLFDVKDGIAHIAVLESTTGVKVTDKDGKTVTLQSGEGISAHPNGMKSTEPKPVDVKEVTTTSPLFTEPDAPKLANDSLIKGVVSAQETAKSQGMSFTSEINDLVAGRIDSATALGKVSSGDVPDIDTAAGSEASTSPAPVGAGAGGISGSQQFNPLTNPNLVPPVNSKPNPLEATPI
jgi:hypothetical protein